MDLDIHKYAYQLEKELKRLEKAQISAYNKEIIKKFDTKCVLEGLSIPRRLKLLSVLQILVKDYFKKDFNKVKTDDIIKTAKEISDITDYSLWTIQGYKAIIKKFFSWFEYGDNYKEEIMAKGYPDKVRWLRIGIASRNRSNIKASDILTEEEVKRLIDCASCERDKAFIALLYELGARVGEIGNIRIGDITRDQYSYILDISGKTGTRTPRIVMSDPYLTAWLNVHPYRDDLKAPLWIATVGKSAGQKILYNSIKLIVTRIVQRSGIKKRVYPHLFRHTRATHLLASKQMNEAQVKIHLGWVPSTRMLSCYSHLRSADVNDRILEIHKIKKEDRENNNVLKPEICPRCNEINPIGGRFCKKCGAVLSVKAALEIENSFDKALNSLVQGEMSEQEEIKIAKILLKLVKESGLLEKYKDRLRVE